MYKYYQVSQNRRDHQVATPDGVYKIAIKRFCASTVRIIDVKSLVFHLRVVKLIPLFLRFLNIDKTKIDSVIKCISKKGFSHQEIYKGIANVKFIR